MKKQNINAICCADSAYGLFLYFLITENNIENTFFFFSDRIPQVYRNKLLGNGILIKLPKTKIRFFHYMSQLYHFFYIPKCFIREKINGLPAYGFDFMEWTNPIITLSKEFYVIEDGFGNYMMPSIELERFKSSWWRRILVTKTKFFHFPYGLSDKVQMVYLTGFLPIPKEIERKVCLIDIKSCWARLDSKKQKFMLDFFLSGCDINFNYNRKILLLTQCWSEANIMSESQKIDLYSRIILKYGEDNIVLKTHPREQTDYKILFPKLEVIDFPVPFQLLNLLEIHFEMAISVNSTAIFSLSESTHKIILLPEEMEEANIYTFAVNKIAEL